VSVAFQRLTPFYTKNIITGSILACTKKLPGPKSVTAVRLQSREDLKIIE